MESFNTYARNIDAKHVLYIFDSCFSGSIFALSRAVPEAINYMTSKPVRQFITAGSENEQVPDRSIFKSQFIAAMRGEADNDRDGYVTGTELGMFLQSKVVNYSTVPIIIAGGPKVETQREALAMVRGAMDAGGAGIIMGRNVWRAENPAAMMRALAMIVREKVSVDDAMEVLLRG